ncbi:MAG: YkgJ family cysteine cluster protein [Pseudobdellovibrionaceae bacterium]|jgi:Fe-S-cluster containining protein
MSTEAKLHPCQTCGACCAYFRVSFSSQELVPRGVTPREAVVHPDQNQVTLKGTEVRHSIGCKQLQGKVGHFVACGIYEKRPSPCRVFEASYEYGHKNTRCDEARARHGLRALTKQDWKEFLEAPTRDL